MYVTYQYYTDEFGGSMPEKQFMQNERKAEAYIRKITYMHGDIFSEEVEGVKDAVCAVADAFYSVAGTFGQTGQGVVKSENTDGYSVTYATEQSDGQTKEELLQKKAHHAAYPYLLPTGWLSRKVGRISDY